MQVGEILDRKGHQVFAVRPEWTLREAAAVIARRNIGTTVVTDPQGALLGIVSERDVVRTMSEVGVGVFDLSVARVMTAAVVTCSPDATVAEALSLMASHRIRHLPVVRNDAVVGIISIRDILEFRLESLEENFAALLRGKREAAHTRAAVERADRIRAEFLAALSDKIKRALHSIADRAEYVSAALPEAADALDHLHDLEEIGVSGRAALEILDNALDLARIHSREREPVLAAVTTPQLIAACADAVREPAARRGVTVSVETSAAAAVPVLVADRHMVRQMLHHLLSNAVKFTPSGGAVAVSCAGDAEGGVRITVTDGGIGMAPEQLGKATQPFYQVEHLTRHAGGTDGAGAGLGLALVEATMQAHHGALQLESRLGIGTTATLRFPPAPSLVGHAEAAD